MRVFKGGKANCLIGTAMALSLAAGAHAVAQTAPPAPAPAASAAAGDEAVTEVVVTARRKTENAQTVPVSVTAIDSSTLATQGIESTNDLQRLVPGVILNGAGSITNSTYTIRGQGKSTTGPGLPSVITYIDEVPLTSIGSYTPTYDIDNVQVLKGPQGTLFGRNTTGGAVLVYTAPPTYEFGGYAQADIGDYSKHSFQGAINIPIVDDKLAVRVAGDLERRDGYTKNVTTGNAQDDLDSNGLRVSILFQPTDGIKNVLVADYFESDTNGQGFSPYRTLNPMTDAAAAAQNALGDRTVRTSIIPFDDDNFSGVSNTTTVDLGIATFKNIFGYRYSGVSNEEDDAGLPATGLPNIGLGALGVVPGQPGILIATKNVSISEQITDEVQFAGTALNDAFSWLLGGFYLDEHPAGQNYLTLDLFRPTPPTATTSFIVNNFLGGIWPVGSQDDTLYGDASRAVFGNVSYDLGQLGSWAEGLKLNAGYRYTWDREQFCGNGRASVSLATGQTVAPPYSGVEQCSQDHGSAYGPLSFDSSAAFKAPTYTFGVDYKLSDNEFLYFTTRRGYRAGGLNAPQLAPSLSGFQDFKPQTVTDYEIGSHTQLKFNEWITRFNIAAFTGDFSQIQQQASGITAASGIPGVTGANQPSNTSLELNVGTVTAEGVEFDGLISPFRGLNFTFGGAYLYEKYDSLDVPQILAPFFTASGFTGAPRWSYQAGLTYVLPLNPDIGAIALHGDFYNIGKEFQGPVLLNEYSLTNLNVQWSEIYGKPIDLTLYVDNVTDTKYIQDIILSTPSFGVYSGGYGAPRMWGARLRYNF